MQFNPKRGRQGEAANDQGKNECIRQERVGSAAGKHTNANQPQAGNALQQWKSDGIAAWQQEPIPANRRKE